MISHRVFLDLFAGTAPVGRNIAEMGYAVLEFDVANGAAADLSCRRTQDRLVGWLKAGLVWGLWLATSCVTSHGRGVTTRQASRGRFGPVTCRTSSLA